MAISKIVQNSLDTTSISLGPKIQSVQVANSTYVVKDDTAVNVAGGYIVVTGQGFQSNCQVLISDGTTSNLACSVSFVSSTTVRAQVPAKSAGTYTVYLINGDGDTAIRINALQYSAEPTWVTTSPLASQQEDSNVSIQLSATGASSYVLQTGSTLPTGLTLSSNGLISGAVNTNVSVETTFNFTVEAIDAENQETPKAFSVTILISDPYFNQTILLLDGDGTSGANNNVFRDSSNNNFTLTRNGNVTQGSLSPYGSNWSNYFNGSTSKLSVPNNAVFTLSANFTIECWFYQTGAFANRLLISKWPTEYYIFTQANGVIGFAWGPYSASGLFGGALLISGSSAFALNTWNHVAVVRNSNTFTLYVNGVSVSSASSSGGGTDGGQPVFIGDYGDGGYSFHGFISNARIVKGTAVYTSNFTPSATPLTAISGTSLLTCADNRFIDDSTNNFTITPTSTSVERFSPFAPTSTYSPTTDGGSAYFDGTGDSVIAGNSSNLTVADGDFTIELWFYPSDTTTAYRVLTASENYPVTAGGWSLYQYGTSIEFWKSTGTKVVEGLSVVKGGSWHHVVLSRQSGTLRLFVNGVLVGSTSDSTSYTGQQFWIGDNNYEGYDTLFFNGYMSNVRFTKGTAVYTSAFTPPTSPVTAITNTQLLANFTNAGIFDDTARNVIETSGNVSVNTSVFKFGTGSIRFNTPIGPKLRLPSTPLLNFGTENFTMECWYYPITKPDIAPCILTNDEVSGYPSNYWALHDRHGQDNGSGTKFSFWCGNAVSGNAPVLNSSTVVSNNNWYHLAVTRTSNTLRLFVNGVMEAANTNVTASLDGLANKPFVLGRSGYGDSGLNGLVEDVRITKGISRYSSNTSFTPPTSTFPTR